MFLQAIRQEKPTNVQLANPSSDHTPCNNCTCSPLEDAFEDAFARGLGAGLGSGNFKFSEALQKQSKKPRPPGCSQVWLCYVHFPVIASHSHL